MGNEQSGDQESEKDELSQPNSQKSEADKDKEHQDEEKKVKTILSDMYPDDLKIDENISTIPTELENIDSKTVQESCPEFEAILDYNNSRLDKFQKSFKTKAVLDKSLRNALDSLSNSITEYKEDLISAEQDNSKYENSFQKLKNAQELCNQAEADFKQNQSQISKEKSGQVFRELETANETLKQKREELNEIKETCARLLLQYTNIVNSQSV